MKRIFCSLLTSITIVALLAACGGDGAAASSTSSGSTNQSLDKLSLLLNFPAYAADHAYYYEGIYKGFYKAAGIDLTIVPGNGSGTTLKAVASGSYPIGLVDATTVMQGVSQGSPVKAIMVMNQTSPASLIYRKDHPIKTAADLKGKTIALTQGDLFSEEFPAVLAKNGLTTQDVHIVSVATAAGKETAVLHGQADAFLGFYTDQPLRIQQTTGVAMDQTPFVDLGINTLSISVIANTDWLSSHKALATRFVLATQKAVAATVANPQEAAELFVENAPSVGFTFTLPLALQEIKETIPLLHTANSQGKPIGWSSQADWQATQNILVKYANLPATNVINYYTNDLVGS
jgi:NitT/TauT family transport system substrate-binding protein